MTNIFEKTYEESWMNTRIIDYNNISDMTEQILSTANDSAHIKAGRVKKQPI
jgi:hypothetical protein